MNLIKQCLKKLIERKGFQIVRSDQHAPFNFLNIRALGINRVLDVGANAGQFASRIHRIIPTAFIDSFEPLPDVYPELERTFSDLNIPGRCHNFALGEHDENLTINLHVNHSPSSSILPATTFLESSDSRTVETKKQDIQVKRLDSIFANLDLPPQSNFLIKMDVQGFEKNVVLGGLETFAKATAVLTEVNLEPLYDGQPSFDEMHALMSKLGFSYAGNFDQSQDPDGKVVAIDTFYIKSNPLFS